ncbi:MAG: serine/threonine-protein kinase, partial [Acidobacteriota bacterium]
MEFAANQMVSHYRLVEKIGEGGMGVVWRAVDTTLDREVAIKVLPDLFAEDPDRLARFEREAKLLASLNHPGIATIHGLHQAGGIRFLAMELAPGIDLARRLAEGPIPIDEALAIALRVAEALEAAHERGVVHRDLKPANILVAPDGKVKILDFGLAKALESELSSGSRASISPTLTTRAGVILGTAAYMSPEQAKGKKVDRRTDIWAFGCILYEMLAGHRPFGGEGVSEVLAAVIMAPVDFRDLPPAAPARIRQLVRRCLEKDPRRRLRDIGEARIA